MNKVPSMYLGFINGPKAIVTLAVTVPHQQKLPVDPL